MFSFLNNISFTITLFFCLCFIFSILINRILLRFAQTLGARGKNAEEIRWSSNVKPALGGISFFVVFLLSYIFLNLLQTFDYAFRLKLVGVLASCTLAFLMGLADDAFNTQPLLKLITQIVCALILIFSGTYIKIFENDVFNLVFTIVWVVGMMNSINMLDNMDGIATLAALGVCTFFILVSISSNQILHPFSVLSIGVMAALLGFLVYNFHPSKIFMGDTGSQFLGVFLASGAINFCWNLPISQTVTDSRFLHFVVVGLVFLLPIIDTVTVIINRITAGQSPFVGGKDHTTHHLFFKGLTEKRISVLFVVLAFIAVSLAYNLVTAFSLTLFWISISFITLVFLALYVNTKIKKS